MIRTGGGRFDPKEENVYFIADMPSQIEWSGGSHTHFLLAINEFREGEDLTLLAGLMDEGKAVLIDSGIYNLATSHARKHAVTMDQALALAPEEIDGFDDLFDRYVEIVRTFGEDAWGYIELDQGGRENKIRTRQRLESMGLRPIPVYHPLNDGWDYFDYLAENYDRICFGNVVQAPINVRKRLVATAWERKRRYPDLWIHLLGLTPGNITLAYPINSADSSTWVGGLRWPLGAKSHADTVKFGALPAQFQYQRGEEDGERGRRKALGMLAYTAHFQQQNWRAHVDGLRSLGATVYPSKGGEE